MLGKVAALAENTMRCIAFPQTPIFPFLSCLQWPRKRFQANPEFVISDLDVSQNKLTVDQLLVAMLIFDSDLVGGIEEVLALLAS